MSYMYKENLNRFDMEDFDGKEYVQTIRPTEEPKSIIASKKDWLAGVVGCVGAIFLAYLLVRLCVYLIELSF